MQAHIISVVENKKHITLLIQLFGSEKAALALSQEETNAALSKFKDATAISPWGEKQFVYAPKGNHSLC